MFNRINRDLVPIKAHYFLFNAATGPMMQFLPTIAKQLGFSGTLVGTIYTILPISGLIAKPLFGGLADKFKLHKAFFIAFQALLAIAFFTINFIPQEVYSANSTLICKDYTYLELCPKKPYLDEKQEDFTANNSSCYLSCTFATEKNVKGLCESWHINDFCSSNATTGSSNKTNKSDILEFEIFIDESYDFKGPKCLEIKVISTLFTNKSVPKAFCSKSPFRIPCIARCPNVPHLNKFIKDISNTESQPKQTLTWNFHWFLWASIISWVGMAVVVSIGDAICFNLLDGSNNKDYGKQKMWGSIGVGIFGISAGYLTDLFSKRQDIKDYTILFYIMLFAMIFDIIVSSTLKKNKLDSTNEPSVLWELWSILREGRVQVFAWWCVGAGMCTGVIWNFLFWYTEEISPDPSQKEWLKTLQGLLTGVQCFFGEMPFNFISGKVLQKIGHINVMSLVLLVFSIRFMAYSLISNAWIFLILEILHGPSLGLCWPTMVSYGDKVAPSGTKATIQGLVGAIFEGIGVSIGSLLCGYLIENYKGVITFRVFSVGALVWLSIFWILQLLLRKAKAYPLQQGHTHLASYAPDDDTILMTMSQEMQTY